eukprot:jgi/Mesen1/289/ME1155943C09510
MLFLGQAVNDEVANQLVGIMMYLNGEDESKELYLYINSPGGAVMAGIAVYDAMQFVVPDVHTICMGLAASMGSFILAGGEITKPDCLLEAEEVLKLRECITRVYSERSGQLLSTVSEDMERDCFMSAAEAQTYGLIDLLAKELPKPFTTENSENIEEI